MPIRPMRTPWRLCPTALPSISSASTAAWFLDRSVGTLPVGARISEDSPTPSKDDAALAASSLPACTAADTGVADNISCTNPIVSACTGNIIPFGAMAGTVALPCCSNDMPSVADAVGATLGAGATGFMVIAESVCWRLLPKPYENRTKRFTKYRALYRALAHRYKAW